jgi:hypothetical protein
MLCTNCTLVGLNVEEKVAIILIEQQKDKLAKLNLDTKLFQ